MGVLKTCAHDFTPKSDRLVVEQTWGDLATIYELSPGNLAVVLLAKVTVVVPVLITDVDLTVPWHNVMLDLDEPEERSYHEDLIQGLPDYRPTVLNHWLKSSRPLPRCQQEGVIIAYGYGPIYANYPEHASATVKLFVKDELNNELCFNFRARVDHSLKRKYERQLRERLAREGSHKRKRLFERNDVDQVPMEELPAMSNEKKRTN
jgi:hypothetical protein